jgi:hypothetical protein
MIADHRIIPEKVTNQLRDVDKQFHAIPVIYQ